MKLVPPNFQGNPQPLDPHLFIKTHLVYRSDLRHFIKALMTACLVYRSARSMPWAGEEALVPIGEQNSTGHDIGPRTSKSSSLSVEPGSRILRGYCGVKGSGTPAHFISSPRPMPRRKKCPRMNKGNPDCQDILPRMTLSSADQNQGKGKRHVARGSPFEHP